MRVNEPLVAGRLPDAALRRLRELTARRDAAASTVQAFLDGIIAGMGLDGSYEVDLNTGVVKPAEKGEEEG